ncbi:MAG: restriction endonuclease subunit S [Fibromonadaceae bacterium]|nr:restriction endonuclease subunit S [Fibromonadaceae bacterium]
MKTLTTGERISEKRKAEGNEKMRKEELEKIILFNPSESIKKGNMAKKISMGKLLPHTKKILGFENVKYSSGPKFKNGDTLLAKITPCLENGKTAFVDILDENEIAFGSSEFIVLRAMEGISDKNYIYYLAKTLEFRSRAISCMKGTSGRKRVNDKTLRSEIFTIPSLPSQSAIAKILSSLDDKIELNNKINKELENLARIIYNYWFVQNAGKKWEKKKIGEIAEVIRGTIITEKQAKKGNIKVVAGGINYSYYHSEFNREKNTITISGSGANAGFVNFWQENIFASDCTTVRGESDIDTILIYQHLKLNQENIFRLAKGSAQPHVYPKDIKDIWFYKVPENIKEKFSSIFIAINEQMAKQQLENIELAKIRDFLLPLLMSGQVRAK